MQVIFKMKYHCIREHVELLILEIKFVKSELSLVDLFPKNFEGENFESNERKLVTDI